MRHSSLSPHASRRSTYFHKHSCAHAGRRRATSGPPARPPACGNAKQRKAAGRSETRTASVAVVRRPRREAHHFRELPVSKWAAVKPEPTFTRAQWPSAARRSLAHSSRSEANTRRAPLSTRRASRCERTDTSALTCDETHSSEKLLCASAAL